MQIGAGAAAEVASPLDEMNRESALCKSARGSQARDTGPDDGDGFRFGPD